jgi:hypothetical protein
MFILFIVKPVVTFLLILVVVLLVMFVWAQTFDKVFLFKEQVKPDSLGVLFLIIGAIVSTIIAGLTIFFITNLAINIPNWVESKLIAQNIKVDRADCPQLIATINKSNQLLEEVEDHRYIEEAAPIFTIKIEYEKGLNQLKKEAQEFSNLELQNNSKYYADSIAYNLNKKAQLFQERMDFKVEGNKNTQDVYKLLEQMDKFTSERLKLISQVKQQCNNS